MYDFTRYRILYRIIITVIETRNRLTLEMIVSLLFVWKYFSASIAIESFMRWLIWKICMRDNYLGLGCRLPIIQALSCSGGTPCTRISPGYTGRYVTRHVRHLTDPRYLRRMLQSGSTMAAARWRGERAEGFIRHSAGIHRGVPGACSRR